MDETAHINEMNKSILFPDGGKMGRRWGAMLGALAFGVLYAFLPQTLTVGPGWLLLVIESILLIPLIWFRLTHHRFAYTIIRMLSLVLLGFVTLALAISVLLLISTLSNNRNGSILLRSALILWCSNVLVFALWYWEVDGGGPYKRFLSKHEAADFMFPQQVNGNTQQWIPLFIDYLFLAFTGATALSPADTYPLTRVAKTLMMVEALLSMAIVILLAARAVNIF